MTISCHVKSHINYTKRDRDNLESISIFFLSVLHVLAEGTDFLLEAFYPVAEELQYLLAMD